MGGNFSLRGTLWGEKYKFQRLLYALVGHAENIGPNLIFVSHWVIAVSSLIALRIVIWPES